ncbi:hypothetical protein ASG49_08780 [Marmoricola sp. Leaf446]|nr:hypothetical protein ASG49_08780 [Marmoricola sp. Leaf446]
MASIDIITTKEVAHLLGVTTKTVFRLIESGDLTRAARGLVDRASVERYLANRQGGRTRVWSEHTAWGALALLSGLTADWLGSVQTSRLRSTLRSIDTEDLIVRLRDRATVHTYTGHRSVITRLSADDRLVVVDTTVLGQVADTTQVNAYLDPAHLATIVGSLGLKQAADGRMTLRVTTFDIDRVRRIANHGTALASVDAATSLDPRTRGLGERTLADSSTRLTA